jgi:hypothetical protein
MARTLVLRGHRSDCYRVQGILLRNLTGLSSFVGLEGEATRIAPGNTSAIIGIGVAVGEVIESRHAGPNDGRWWGGRTVARPTRCGGDPPAALCSLPTWRNKLPGAEAQRSALNKPQQRSQKAPPVLPAIIAF